MVVASLFFFYALKQGPVAVIVMLTALYPLVSLVLARVVLKEKLNRTQYVAIGMAMGAVALLAG
jgi:transporter family protein